VRASEKQQKIFVSMKYTAKQEHRSAAATFLFDVLNYFVD
jgi:hypothetical protein